MIRPAKVVEIPGILEIARACAASMRARGIFQWDENYPSRAALEHDLDRGELWVFEKAGAPVAMVVVSTHMDREYEPVSWLTASKGNRYVHRLGVHPGYQRQGIAGKLMDFAEGLARDAGAPSVRLDTFSRNPGNQQFYERRGYTRLGVVYFPAQSAYPFYCYELPLSP